MGANDAAVPLVVDVDGTLHSGDLLVEGAMQIVANRAAGLFVLLLWLLSGRAAFKRRIAQAVPADVEALMLNSAVLEEMAAAKAAGRDVWLASAADAQAVAVVAREVGATGWFASDGRTNLAGRAKAEALVERFGEGGFDYIGNERRDLAVWRRARHAFGVGLPPRLERQVRTLDAAARMLPGPGGRWRDYLRALRPHQWLKNLLVFVPLFAAHEFTVSSYWPAVGVFVALSACASAAYLCNDLLDLPHDRRRSSRCGRPLAAGKVMPLRVLALALALMASGLAYAFWLSAAAGACVLFYLLLSLAYSLWLKRLLLADVIALATLYGVRLIAGAMSAAIVPSPWILAFFLFFFLALATVKRQGELSALRAGGGSMLSRRPYRVEDLAGMAALAMASGSASIVVLAFYIQSSAVSMRYSQPELLWLLCPLLVYWLARMVLLASRDEHDLDPVAFAMCDLTSWIVLGGMLAVFFMAM